MVVKRMNSVEDMRKRKVLDREKIGKSLDKASEYGASYAEVRLVSSNSTSMALKDGQLEKSIPSNDVAATLRILADGSWGVYSTTDLESIAGAVESTTKLAKSVASRRSKADAPISLAEVPIITDEIHWQTKCDNLTLEFEQRLEFLKELDSAVSDDDRIVSSRSGWSDEHIHTELLTSEGMDRTWSFQRTLINTMATARDGSELVSYRTRSGGEGGWDVIKSVDLQEIGEDARKSAIRLLSAERAPSGTMPLIADPDLTGVYIHEALGHPCEADLVSSGDSCLAGKLGEKIGNEMVTVSDDPTIRGGYGAYPIDDEGVDVREKKLIVNGVLKEYLNHRQTAAEFGLDPNGGARAQDGLHHPLVRMSNTVIHGGTYDSLEDLAEDIQYGVYACGSRGGQVDTGRGSFQFAAQEAWLIENGKITKPLKDVSVSGLTLEILQNVNGLTKDSSLAGPGFCGKGQTVPVGDGGPTMRISDALVG